jgi:hypothetical protein
MKDIFKMSLKKDTKTFFVCSLFLWILIVIFGPSIEALRKPARIYSDYQALKTGFQLTNDSKSSLVLLYEFLTRPNQETINLVYKFFLGQFIFILINIVNGVLKLCLKSSIKIWLWLKPPNHQRSTTIKDDDSKEETDPKCELCGKFDTELHRPNCLADEKRSLATQFKKAKCIFCQKKFRQSGSDNILISSCRHVFHRECVEAYLKNRRVQQFTCPVCRRRGSVGRIFF